MKVILFSFSFLQFDIDVELWMCVCAWVKSRILSGYLLQRRNFKSGTVLQSDFIFYLTKQDVLKTENNIKEIPTKVPRYTVKKWNLFVVVVYKITFMNHGIMPSIFAAKGWIVNINGIVGGNENLIEILMKHK